MADSRYEWVGVDEASRRLGKSRSTVRRMCEDPDSGLTCEREPRARGDTRDRWLVRFERRPADAPADPTQDAPSAQPAPTDASAALTEALGTIGALVEQTAAQAAQIADLSLRLGRAEGDAAAAATRAADLAQNLRAQAETIRAQAETIRAERELREAAEDEAKRLREKTWWQRLWNR